jgi:hypothetical protein
MNDDEKFERKIISYGTEVLMQEFVDLSKFISTVNAGEDASLKKNGLERK